MSLVKNYKDLHVWQKSMAFVTHIYALSACFPKEEQYGLTSQLRRAAVSIPSNIAEGRARKGTREFVRFLNIAYGSAAEVETQILIARNLGFLTYEDADIAVQQIDEISRMLHGLMAKLEDKTSSPPPALIPHPSSQFPHTQESSHA